MAPAERGAGAFEFLAHGAEIFLGVEGAVFTAGVLEQEIEHRLLAVAQRAVMMHQGTGAGLEVAADGFLGVAEKLRGIGGLDAGDVILERKRFPVEEVAAAVGAVAGGLPCAENEAGAGISRIAGAGEVAPCVGAVAGVNADGVAVNTARRFAGGFLLWRTSMIAQKKLIRGQRDGFADM